MKFNSFNLFNGVRMTAALVSLLALIAGTILAQTNLVTLLWLILPIVAYAVATWWGRKWLIHIYLFMTSILAMAGMLMGHDAWLMLTAVLASVIVWYIADLMGRGGTADNFPKAPHLIALGCIALLTGIAHAIVNARVVPLSSRWLMSLGAVLIISLIQISRLLAKIDQQDRQQDQQKEDS